MGSSMRFAFRFDGPFALPLALIGVTPRTAEAIVDDTVLRVRFGPWSLRTEFTNVDEVKLIGSSSWYKAIGPRLSLADRGVTFGTSTRGMVCVVFREPVGGIDPFHSISHPGMTLTLEDPQGFMQAVEARAVRR